MNILADLNPKQREAVITTEGPLMIVAGPGSGKTRVLTYKVAYLLNKKVLPVEILALTFTNKAALEMKNRISQFVGADINKLWIGTFHSISARILRVECGKLGFKNNFSIYDNSDSVALLKNIIVSLGIPVQQCSPYRALETISRFKNKLVSPDEWTSDAKSAFDEKIVKIYFEYQKCLKRNNAMDFDDLILKPIELFSGYQKILEKYQDRFRYILIDEYQDTNRAQYTLINKLAKRSRNICVVGDDAQSIYSFRGAEIRNILNFEKDYPDAQTIRLEQNYRSTKTILNAADQLIKHNNEQISKNLWTDNTEGDPITVLICDDDKEEGSNIAHYIKNESLRLKIDFKDFAVMFRTNAQSRSIEDGLRLSNIPYTIVGGVEFYKRKEIKGVLAYLRLLVNPQDDESFLRIVNYPSRGIGNKTLVTLKKFAAKHSINLLETAGSAETGIPNQAKLGLRSFSLLMEKYRALLNSMSASELSRAIVDEIGILKMYKEENTAESLSRGENVKELLSAISEFCAHQPEANLSAFLQEISLLSDVDQWDDKHNSVALMTIHSAKGLEFPVVFIAGLEEGLLPFYVSELDNKTLEEERRLYYVGVTRAIKKLYLTHTRLRYRFGEVTYPSLSRFVTEIDKSLIETISEFNKMQSKREQQTKKEIDSHYFTDSLPDYDLMSESTGILQEGAVVYHDMFGQGKVVLLSGTGEMMKAVVDFQKVGRKNLMVKYANLKLS